MAERTYTVTVASGSLYGGGTGNVYYLDGARNSTGPGTVSWVQGATLRFDQSDSSNDNHPLIFSTTTSRDQYLTSGVTYYLDGSSSYSNYINSTTFNAATTRYVEVTPSSQTDFYYLCYYHGIGMGGIFDITSNTWGALEWGQGSWAAQGDVGLSLTGLSSTFSINSVTVDAELQVGWGGDTWGENEWGDLSGSQPTITGVQASLATSGISSVTADANVSVTGVSLSSSVGDETAGISFLAQITGLQISSLIGAEGINIGVPVTGSQFTSSIGAATVDESILTGEGWGRAEWGEFAWGVNYSVAVTGQSLSSSIGEETAFTDCTVQVSGQSLTSTLGSFSLVGDFGIIVFAAEDQLDFTIGSLGFVGDANVTVTSAGSLTGSVGNTIAGLKTPVDVTGIQGTFTQGTATLVQSTTEPVTGVQATLSLGQHTEIPSQIVGAGGQQMSGSIGSVTITGTAGIDVTGIQMSASVGNVILTPWQEVDLGVNNVWSEVDLAA